MDGFELIPLILIILWSIFGAKSAKRKQEEQRRRAEEQRRANEAKQRAGGVETRESGGSVGAGTRAGTRTTAGTPTTASTGRDSAADMVPDDLWAILTGGTPPPRPQPPARVPPLPEPEYEEDPAPAEPGGWVTSPPWDEEDAVDSIEGVSYENVGRETIGYDDAAEGIARARYEDLRDWSWDEAPRAEASSFASDETSERRHVAFHTRLRDRDIEIGSEAEAARVPSLQQRLGIGDLGQVRRAIVLAEVLGPPKSLQ
ncbi:MAG TPA: hypothetical protein VMN78_12145 [Longimicrobiales bacterium]|nr:hypothetical protein [Longimicrobiales bacterium]